MMIEVVGSFFVDILKDVWSGESPDPQLQTIFTLSQRILSSADKSIKCGYSTLSNIHLESIFESILILLVIGLLGT